MVLADLNLGDLLWFMVGLFFLFIWIMILFNIFGDLFRDKSESGLTKLLWVLFIFIVPFLGAFVYLIVRGSGMSERAIDSQKRVNEQMADYAQSLGGGSPADHIAQAKQLLDAGTIDQAEFERLKAKALS